MALQSVFASPLHFGEGDDQNQAKDHEREENETNEDLEEGEIADDDEELEEVDKNKGKTDDKKEDTKLNGSSDIKSAASAADKTESKSNAGPGPDSKRRDKRRSRKRASDDEYPDNRDMPRKRRRNQEEGEMEEDEDMDLEMMNVRGHSPLSLERERQRYDSGDSDYERSPSPHSRRSRTERTRTGRTSPRRRTRANSRDRERDRRRIDRDRDRDRRPLGKSVSGKMKDDFICSFYMEGKCSRGSDCPYSHAAVPPRKMELCKFYLMDCCAKKEKCLYMHKDFPCKFFHTGKKCRHGTDDCKFSHEPLSEITRAILIKHIETAPREILGDFPRLTREETIQAIDSFSPVDNHQSQLNGRDKRPHIPSLFELHLGPPPTESQQNTEDRTDDSNSSTKRSVAQEIAEPAPEDNRSPENSRSIWFGQLRQETGKEQTQTDEQHPTIAAQPETSPEESKATDYLSTLPKRQRELYLRIQQQQREPQSLEPEGPATPDEPPADDKWYSSDEEEEGKSLSDVLKSIKPNTEAPSKSEKSAVSAIPNLNLSSLDNINVVEIAKALSSLQGKNLLPTPSIPGSVEDQPTSDSGRRDPRMRDPRMRNQPQTASTMGDVDLRLQNRQDVDLRVGSCSDVDLRSSVHSGLAPLGNLDDIGSSDIDLRRLGLPFKPAPLHPPAKEIEASITSHPPMDYQVVEVDCEPRNYALIQVHMEWAHLDPRLQKNSASTRAFTSTEPPSIPLGPASPDPIPSRVYEPEPSYQPNRWAPNDPRARDPRRSASAAVVEPNLHTSRSTHLGSNAVGVPQQSGGSIPDPRGKPGLLGAAPPGMLPLKVGMESEDTSFNNTGFRGGVSPYDRVYDSGGQNSPRPENRRDPRHRLRNVSLAPDDDRSYVSTTNERVFR